jgi:DnaJ-class molecular chaperone
MFENDPHAAEMKAANRTDTDDDSCPVCDGTGEIEARSQPDYECRNCDGTGEAIS